MKFFRENPDVASARGRTTAKILNTTYWTQPQHKARAASRTRRLNELGKMGQQAPNGLESLLIPFLPKKVRFVGNAKWWRRHPDGKAMNPDFKVRGANIVIELYGDYWHRDHKPRHRVQRWNRVGMRCLVLWEREVRANPAKAARRIARFCGLPMPS